MRATSRQTRFINFVCADPTVCAFWLFMTPRTRALYAAASARRLNQRPPGLHCTGHPHGWQQDGAARSSSAKAGTESRRVDGEFARPMETIRRWRCCLIDESDQLHTNAIIQTCPSGVLKFLTTGAHGYGVVGRRHCDIRRGAWVEYARNWKHPFPFLPISPHFRDGKWQNDSSQRNACALRMRPEGHLQRPKAVAL